MCKNGRLKILEDEHALARSKHMMKNIVYHGHLATMPIVQAMACNLLYDKLRQDFGLSQVPCKLSTMAQVIFH